MPETITTAQVERLREAVARARGPGKGKYVLGSEPCCVIAQLGALEGVTLEELAGWDVGVVSGDPDEGLVSVASLLDAAPRPPGIERLASYPKPLLDDLQCRWDNTCGGYENTARADMLSMVEGWPLEVDTRGGTP